MEEEAEKGLGPYACMHKGDLVCFEYSVRANKYEKDGRMVYNQILQIENVALKESKAVCAAHAMQSAAPVASLQNAAPGASMQNAALEASIKDAFGLPWAN